MSVQALRREPAPSIALEQLQATLERQRSAFLAQPVPSYQQRREHLRALLALVLDNEGRVTEALASDFGSGPSGRSPEESRRIEVLPCAMAIRHSIRHLRRWMRPSRRSTHWATWPSRARVEYVPLGVIGVISPWNYPITLALGPLAGSLAAGNRAMLKPSELTPATSALLSELLAKTYDESHVAVATGGVEVAQAFSSLPFDHLLFTGSTSVGRHVMRAASEHLVPVTLELGGKSPTLIDEAFDIGKEVGSLVHGKWMNAGQTCIAPDYLLVHESRVDEVVERLRLQVAKHYPSLALNDDYTAIINERHRERLLGYLEDAREKGATLLEINPGDEAAERFAETNKIPPTLVLDVSDSMRIMQDEIFGPLLPIKPYKSVDEAIEYVNARPRPLAAYVYSDRRAVIERFGSRVVSGALSVNAAAIHFAQDELPFGGVGHSGMGRYHSHEGFLTFSHQKAVYHQLRPNLMHLVAPPYQGELKRRMLDFLLSFG